MTADIKTVYSVIALLMSLVAFVPFALAIIRGDSKPHVFSWVIWTLTTLIVFFAQVQGHAGVGAWPTALGAMIALSVTVMAIYKRADISITRLDWVFFASAMAAIPVWLLTSDPMWAVILVTSIDILGFAPTFRKAYHHPYDEHVFFYAMLVLRNVFSLLALEHYSTTTLLFPLAIAIAGAALVLMITYRKQQT